MSDDQGVVRGVRTIRFESGGPTPAVAVGPDSVLDQDGVRVRVRVEDGGASIELRAEVEQGERARLIEALDVLAAQLADPERRAATASPGSEPGKGADLPTAPRSIDRTEAVQLAIRSVDLTTLAGDDTPGRIRALCAQALHPDPTDPDVGPVAAVCVYPALVATANEILAGTAVKVASVAGAFPSGLSSLDVRLRDIDDALAWGADEIDVVLNRSAFLAGDAETAVTELRAMRDRVGSAAMKVILETSELDSPTLIRSAASLAIDAGADWVKTSTGKSSQGATPEGVVAMCEAVAAAGDRGGRPVGIKISGGVRTADDAIRYLAIVESVLGSAWLTPDRIRFGASGLLRALVLAT